MVLVVTLLCWSELSTIFHGNFKCLVLIIIFKKICSLLQQFCMFILLEIDTKFYQVANRLIVDWTSKSEHMEASTSSVWRLASFLNSSEEKLSAPPSVYSQADWLLSSLLSPLSSLLSPSFTFHLSDSLGFYHLCIPWAANTETLTWRIVSSDSL